MHVTMEMHKTPGFGCAPAGCRCQWTWGCPRPSRSRPIARTPPGSPARTNRHAISQRTPDGLAGNGLSKDQAVLTYILASMECLRLAADTLSALHNADACSRTSFHVGSLSRPRNMQGLLGPGLRHWYTGPCPRLQIMVPRHARADLRASIAAVAAHHEHHVDRPHVDALDYLLYVCPAARRALQEPHSDAGPLHTQQDTD